MVIKNKLLILVLSFVAYSSAFGALSVESAIESSKFNSKSSDNSVVLAINLGGKSYMGADGINYLADPMDNGNSLIGAIKGAQDPSIFQSYRLGASSISRTVANGRYDIILKFAEPETIGSGKRVFNVIAEGIIILPKLDVISARDGNAKSALVTMIPNVEVSDGELNIELEPVIGAPIISALVVRKNPVGKKNQLTDDNWSMTWNDEFDYNGAPNSDKWSYDIWPAKKVNNEDQTYTDRLKNVRVEKGMLVIEARREDYNNAKFTSGRIHSAGKADLLYGRVEVRAKLPAGRGTWPAIWMLPSDPFRYAEDCDKSIDWQGNEDCSAWPNSGEIDIMEHVGYDMNRVHGTVHTKAYYWVNGEQRKSSVSANNVDQEFHVYAMEWSPERIDVFYDGSLYFTYLNQGQGWEAWPYDHPFHLILNVAVGGGWGGAGGPTDIDAFPTKMLVDYVRMYKKKLQ
jgi:beta-glucanase (GH16 family)